MKRERQLEIAHILYKPTPKVEEIVMKMVDLFDTTLPINNGEVTIKSMKFRGLTIAGLEVREVVMANDHTLIEVHWVPNYRISTTRDPFCSAFALRYNSLQKLYKAMERKIFNLKCL